MLTECKNSKLIRAAAVISNVFQRIRLCCLKGMIRLDITKKSPVDTPGIYKWEK